MSDAIGELIVGGHRLYGESFPGLFVEGANADDQLMILRDAALERYYDEFMSLAPKYGIDPDDIRYGRWDRVLDRMAEIYRVQANARGHLLNMGTGIVHGDLGDADSGVLIGDLMDAVRLYSRIGDVHMARSLLQVAKSIEESSGVSAETAHRAKVALFLADSASGLGDRSEQLLSAAGTIAEAMLNANSQHDARRNLSPDLPVGSLGLMADPEALRAASIGMEMAGIEGWRELRAISSAALEVDKPMRFGDWRRVQATVNNDWEDLERAVLTRWGKRYYGWSALIGRQTPVPGVRDFLHGMRWAVAPYHEAWNEFPYNWVASAMADPAHLTAWAIDRMTPGSTVHVPLEERMKMAKETRYAGVLDPFASTINFSEPSHHGRETYSGMGYQIPISLGFLMATGVASAGLRSGAKASLLAGRYGAAATKLAGATGASGLGLGHAFISEPEPAAAFGESVLLGKAAGRVIKKLLPAATRGSLYGIPHLGWNLAAPYAISRGVTAADEPPVKKVEIVKEPSRGR